MRVFLKSCSPFLLAIGLMTSSVVAADGDPLSSWNDTAVKRASVEIVERVTSPESEDFVPTAERTAVFDNDGTLWSEQPMVFPYFFHIRPHPAVRTAASGVEAKEPFASLFKDDLKSAFAVGESPSNLKPSAQKSHTML